MPFECVWIEDGRWVYREEGRHDGGIRIWTEVLDAGSRRLDELEAIVIVGGYVLDYCSLLLLHMPLQRVQSLH